jgi:tRNA 2-selenouridine synthase
MSAISPEELLEALQRRQAGGSAPAMIDVRSEGEFEVGALPGFVNLPILRNEERHQVGLAYKHEGQDEAIALGHRLVDPDRPARVSAWLGQIAESPLGRGVVTCWRGGLRSGIASQWMREAGAEVVTVLGGYKAVRGALLQGLESPPPFWILSGLTGSGKTKVLKLAEFPKVDLEALANHRGSAFGLPVGGAQPSQATFENALALTLWRKRETHLLEDESRLIGLRAIPTGIKERMTRSKVIVLETTLEERVAHIFDEYIREPLGRGISRETLFEALNRSLHAIAKKLGGLQLGIISGQLQDAFAGEVLDPARHEAWISGLLLHYYDKLYQHGFNRQEREVIFRGRADAVLEFLRFQTP